MAEAGAERVFSQKGSVDGFLQNRCVFEILSSSHLNIWNTGFAAKKRTRLMCTRGLIGPRVDFRKLDFFFFAKFHTSVAPSGPSIGPRSDGGVTWRERFYNTRTPEPE